MAIHLKWKKGIFSETYHLYNYKKELGKMSVNSFRQSAIAEMNGQKYMFKTKGFLKQSTDVIDMTQNQVIGTISYNNWMTRAHIRINEKQIQWKYENVWNTKWHLFNEDNLSIHYSGSSSKGHIASTTEEALPLLSGLFTAVYYWQMTILIIVTASIPILILVFR